MARMTKAERMQIKALIDSVREELEHAEDDIADTKFYLTSLERVFKASTDKGEEGEDGKDRHESY